MKKIILVSGLAVLAFGQYMVNMGDFDLNKDGVVTQKEFKAARELRMRERAEAGMPMRNAGNAPMFEEFDTNKDGVIDSKEFEKHREEMRNQRMEERGQGGYGGGMGMGAGGPGKGNGGKW